MFAALRIYSSRLIFAAAVCGGAYFYGLPYVLFGAQGSRCDYYGPQGHRWIFSSYANCPNVKFWELRYPIVAMYNGDDIMPPPYFPPSRPIWQNVPRK